MDQAIEEGYMSVKEFADATHRFPNQIYDLINKGNQFRKLRSKLIDGKIYVHESEIEAYPFNEATKVRIELEHVINELEATLIELLELVEEREAML